MPFTEFKINLNRNPLVDSLFNERFEDSFVSSGTGSNLLIVTENEHLISTEDDIALETE